MLCSILEKRPKPYKAAQSFEFALEVIAEERAKQFDPHLVDVFLQLQPTIGLPKLKAAIGQEEAPRTDADRVSSFDWVKDRLT